LVERTVRDREVGSSNLPTPIFPLRRGVEPGVLPPDLTLPSMVTPPLKSPGNNPGGLCRLKPPWPRVRRGRRFFDGPVRCRDGILTVPSLGAGCSPDSLRTYSPTLHRFRAWLQTEGLADPDVKSVEVKLCRRYCPSNVWIDRKSAPRRSSRVAAAWRIAWGMMLLWRRSPAAARTSSNSAFSPWSPSRLPRSTPNR
jgi:hypothetical protein